MHDIKDVRRANMAKARDNAYADAEQRVRFQASFAEKMLNALMVANGGAIVGLFTFIGNLVGKKGSPIVFSVTPLWVAFALFVLGLGLTLAAHLFAFLSQQMFYYQAIAEAERFERGLMTDEPEADRSKEEAHNRSGGRHYMTGLGLAFFSILFFVVGCGSALFGLLPR
ncbi:hypothetical protein FIM10_04115 [Sphingomonadales bacterium 56]|uniref:hypothetical protein n=1 Tax=unclassified Sphingobium TaxID=2611147 RepID=UPI00191A7D3E|nr:MULTISPECIES: hypothetical protein [unclassified Sphingobium]MBY2927861.1 hypothetical protein [Sphingomonadales bacterium 56]MBY2957961.1 hypothetical protein [Sphingomonadales bacterium 58]CAD7336088.1 hypothetical protein SPHS6_00835 [Sphingobium sp. S6]CAD7336153.1 hypothetical protein SPHS8_00876 [Sphingobium sp. S8]